jgi:MFS family permease
MGTFLRVTLPLAGVNFINQASRTVVATIGPLLAVEFALSASELGLLAAVFFAAYAAAQLPVGLALDMFGARRVQTTLSLVAALGFLLCALAQDPLALAVGRVVTGLGISAGLMAMLKANSQWYPKEKVAAVTGAGVFMGAMGGLSATLPVQWLLPVAGWRGAFWVLALLGVAMALWIHLSVPERPQAAPPTGAARRGLWQEVAEFGRIFRHPAFLRFVPSIALLSALNFTYQGLWVGPWLRDVGGLEDESRAALLLVYALGLMMGSLLSGQAASWLQRRGASPMAVPIFCMGVIAAIQLALALSPRLPAEWLGLLWLGFSFCAAAGPVGYAAIGQRFGPELAGRVATAVNLSMLCLVFLLQNVIGWILDLWPRSASGGWSPEAYGWAMGLTVLLQGLAGLWMLAAPRRMRSVTAAE